MTWASQIYVVGNSRSGTTMLTDMIGGHDEVASLRELHFFEQLWQPQDAERQLSRGEALALAERLVHNQRQHVYDRPNSGEYAAEAATIVDELPPDPLPHQVYAAALVHEAQFRHGVVPTDQTPRNVFYLREILRLFPKAAVVVITRDPRDVLLSQKRWWRRRFKGMSEQPMRVSFRQWADYHPFVTALLWRGGVRAADAVTDERIRHVRFEDVLNDPEGEIRGISEWLGLEFQPRMLQVLNYNSSVANSGGRRGVDASVAGRWRNGLNSTEVWICERINGPEMRRHGYELAQLRPSPLSLAGATLLLPVKLVLAFLLNASRTRNLVSSVKLRLARH